MYYSIGEINLKTKIKLPASYDQFCTNPPVDDNKTIILLEASEKPDLDNAFRISETLLMIVWKKNDTWIFESPNHNGYLTVNKDYSKGEFYCSYIEENAGVISNNITNSSDSVPILQPLLQAMLECRLIYEGFGILHSSCVQLDSKAIAFSAPSGTGKSERALGFTKYLGASWISGDRPAVELVSGKAFGVPWDGKEQIFVNTSAPLLAIAEIRRGGNTLVREMTKKQKMQFLSTQLMIPMWDTELTRKAFVVLQQMIDNIPIYRLYCDISEQSIRQAYDILFIHQEKIKKARVDITMRLKENFEIIEIAGDYMAIPTGENMAHYGGSVVLNEVSAFLLKAMKKPVTEEELLELLLNEYEVDREKAATDLKNILSTFENLGLIEK